jgi:hypothetical protein
VMTPTKPPLNRNIRIQFHLSVIVAKENQIISTALFS